MAAAAYQPVAVIPGSSNSTGSHDSSQSAQLTPESDEYDDNDVDIDDLEAEEGLELSELGRHGGKRSPFRRQGTELDDDDNDDPTSHLKPSHLRRRRRESTHSFELYTPTEETRVRRKLDTRLVLFVALLYLIGFLDRSNIGNARIAGLTTDLHLSSTQFEWLLTAFYITYVLFEWMTLCYKIFPPHIYISCCVAAWGVLASLQALVRNFGQLVVLRALLGVGEAAFVGMPFYLSFFFRRDELAFRTGLFISAAPLATSFAGSLAFAIMSLGDKTPIASWRLLFLLEGFPACLIAVIAYTWLPDSPASARWLTPRERRVAVLRLRKESASTSEKSNLGHHSTLPRHKQKFNWTEVAKTLRDPKTYLTASIFFCLNVSFASVPVFLPTIVNAMGYTPRAAQGLTAPPFLLAFVAVLLTAYLSDRGKTRSWPMIFHAFLCMSGYVVLAAAETLQLGTAWRYAAIFPICAGLFSAVTIVITWTVNNQDSDEGKGTGMAVLNFIGQLGPLVGTKLYPDRDGPYFVKGSVVCAACMGVVAVLAFVLRIVLRRENAGKRARWKGLEGEGLVGGQRREEFLYIT